MTTVARSTTLESVRSPWLALVALLLGFFMIMVDTTIVNVAIPAILRGLNAELNQVIWVTSAYLLAYAVPLLITGRLGDRFGPKRIFQAGLVVFTFSSLWCGLSGSADMLILARVFQGLGAAMLTPQTMAIIGRVFPAERRGAAMGWWGAVAGIATILGPLLGGVLVDSLGWEWIFFVNVPVGVIAFTMAQLFIPGLAKNRHRFDIPGVILSAAGFFALIFGVQEGQQYNWGTIAGPVSVWSLIGAGVVVLALFVWRQRAVGKRDGEPLVPLALFSSRNFSWANISIFTVGFAITSMMLPAMLYLQAVLGLSPTQAALVLVPMSLLSGILSPFVGRLSDMLSPKWLALAGLTCFAGGLFLLTRVAHPDSNVFSLIPPTLLMGIGTAGMFSPLTVLATSTLAPKVMGAGSGVFNTARQLGAVFGSAVVGVVLQARLAVTFHDEAANAAGALPQPFRQPFIDGMTDAAAGGASLAGSAGFTLPAGIPDAVAAQIRTLAREVFTQGLTTAVTQTLLVPVAVVLLGAVATLFLRTRRRHRHRAG